jgi:glc operon protein GlcG
MQQSRFVSAKIFSLAIGDFRPFPRRASAPCRRQVATHRRSPRDTVPMQQCTSPCDAAPAVPCYAVNGNGHSRRRTRALCARSRRRRNKAVRALFAFELAAGSPSRPVHKHSTPRRTEEMIARTLVVALVAWLGLCASAQAQIPQYGANITLEQAKKVVAAADAEARKNNWPMAIAVVDTAGILVLYQKHDNTQTASVQVAQDKAVSAAIYRRPTKAFQDLVAKGGDGLRVLGLRGASPVEGGVPLYVDGKIIGAIGVSGAASDQDGLVAKAGAEQLK